MSAAPQHRDAHASLVAQPDEGATQCGDPAPQLRLGSAPVARKNSSRLLVGNCPRKPIATIAAPAGGGRARRTEPWRPAPAVAAGVEGRRRPGALRHPAGSRIDRCSPQRTSARCRRSARSKRSEVSVLRRAADAFFAARRAGLADPLGAAVVDRSGPRRRHRDCGRCGRHRARRLVPLRLPDEPDRTPRTVDALPHQQPWTADRAATGRPLARRSLSPRHRRASGGAARRGSNEQIAAPVASLELAP